MSQAATPQFLSLSLLTVFFEVPELFPRDTLNSIKTFSCDILIPACNQSYYVWLFTIIWDTVAAVCSPFWFWGILQNRSWHPSLFPGFLFIRLSVLEIHLEQLYVSFVTRREAQHDVMGKAVDLGLSFFCLVLVLTCCVTLGTACHPCVSFFSWHSSACLFPLDVICFWAVTSFPCMHTHTLI